MRIIPRIDIERNTSTEVSRRTLRHGRISVREWAWSALGMGLGLTSADVFVFARIYETTRGERGIYTEPQEHLASALDLHPNTVAACLRRLRDAKFVVRCSHNCGVGQADRYIVNLAAVGAAIRRVLESKDEDYERDPDEIVIEEWMWASAADGGLNLRLGSADLAVYASVYEVTRSKKGEFVESQGSMAKRLGLTRRAVNEALGELEERGLVTSRDRVDEKGRRAAKAYEAVQEAADRAIEAVLHTARRHDVATGDDGIDPFEVRGVRDADPVSTAACSMLDVSPQRVDEERANRVSVGVRRLYNLGVKPQTTQLAYDLYRRWLKRCAQTGERVRVMEPDRFLEELGLETLIRFLDSAQESLYGSGLSDEVREKVVEKGHPKYLRNRYKKSRAA